MITKQDVLKAQTEWRNAIVKVGQMKDNLHECEVETDFILSELYAFDDGIVLFKPTKASVIQFRATKESAKSYFIGGNAKFPEDVGFALHPWTNVRFENHNMILADNRALVMGNYFFLDIHGKETKVEFTFGYKSNNDGRLKIDVHHSSLPYVHQN
ncbi:MAG: hypothetical protein FJY07_08895 [Bacteroidetes bacterium]|nr:hypothetical protein [Bacteroidota bacterium]